MDKITKMSEISRRIIRNMGINIGTDREGRLGIFEAEIFRPFIQYSNSIIAQGKNKSIRINYEFNNKEQRTAPELKMISVTDKLDDSELTVIPCFQPGSTKIKLTKSYCGNNFTMDITLSADGTINIDYSDSKSFGCSLEESKYYDAPTAKKLLANLEIADARILPLVECFSNLQPNLLQTLTNINKASARKSGVIKVLTITPLPRSCVSACRAK